MIFRELYEFAKREHLLDDVCYDVKPVHYLVHIGEGGKYLGYTAPRIAPEPGAPGKRPGKERVVERRIPRRSKRAAQSQAEFLVDKADYVFGIDPEGKAAPKRTADRRRLFRAAVASASSSLAGSASLSALGEFLDSDVPTDIRELLTAGNAAEKAKRAGELFAFVYEPHGGVACIHDEDDVREYLIQQSDQEGDDLRGQCLVTGQKDVPLARLHGAPKGVPPVSITKRGVPITTTNSAAQKSYGLGDLGCATISASASRAIEIALTRLLSSDYQLPNGERCPKQFILLSSDTALVFWSRGSTPLDFMTGLEEETPDRVLEMMKSPVTGRLAPINDTSSFFGLVLSGTTGRAIVRSLIDTTVQKAAERIEAFLSESTVVRPYGEVPGGYPLHRLRRSLAARGEVDALPPTLSTELVVAVVLGRSLPRSVLQAAVRRFQVEPLPKSKAGSGKTDETVLASRASLIKTYMIRNLKEEIPVSLDTRRADVPYRLGRLLATLDRVQQDALGPVNATLVDRYFGSASTTPGAVFPTLIRRSQHHVSKLRKEKPGLAVNHDRLIQSVLDPIGHFPSTLGLEEQGRFVLGFYHQRQDFFTPKDKTEVSND